MQKIAILLLIFAFSCASTVQLGNGNSHNEDDIGPEVVTPTGGDDAGDPAGDIGGDDEGGKDQPVDGGGDDGIGEVNEPTVTGISGNPVHGNTLLISGGGFGAKENAAPFKWDDFESGTVNDYINSTGWEIYKGDEMPVFTDINSYGYGTKSAYRKTPLNTEWGGSEDFRSAGLKGLNSLEIYYSVYFYWEIYAGNCDAFSPILKLIRINSAPDFYDSWPGLLWTARAPSGSSAVWLLHTSIEEDHTSDLIQYTDNLPSGQWKRLEVYLKFSNPAGEANGEVRAWVDQKQGYFFQGVTRSAIDSESLIDNFLLPGMVSDHEATALFNFYSDDVYVDTTQARVEIGNSQNWNDCTKREIQIPMSWSDRSISIQVNQGSFSDLTDKYLFVVDKEGKVSSQGFSLSAD